MRNGVDLDFDLAAGVDMHQLGFLIVCGDPYLRAIHNVEKSLARLYKLAYLNLLA